ncbi:MAG: hypothetical protein FJX03_05685 [Alphaproteobacteria bacterium]|nr:hypothetical protein [Alphaproteobacteria bacterium]
MKKFLSLSAVVLLLNVETFACEDAKVVNDAVARANSSQQFGEEMKAYGGVKQIMSSGNFHESAEGWGRFKAYILQHPLVLRPTKEHNPICVYDRYNVSGGSLGVVLNKKVAAK